ncbi:ADP-ribosylglycohydrolase family protein [Chloroflexia bacterium SDU3-3]|nr:ADP-ribosylglycohydrolase family protein [Chloroflexia bacterium SDU3-3]
MLIELAIGDAYGAGFEGVNAQLIRQFNTLAAYTQHPRHSIRPGRYTDDTQMSIAIAEAIVHGDPWTPEALAERFVAAFKRDAREGYAQRFHTFLTRIRDGGEFLRLIEPHSDKSGAAMRAGPIGVFPSIAEVAERATVQARLTHDTPDGVRAAVAAALMTHYGLYRLGPLAEIGPFLEAHVEGRWSEPWRGKVGPKGWMSVQAAVTVLTRNRTMSGLLRDCVAFGGDVDTVATIALAAGACSADMVQDLPAHLVAGLENGTYGRDYLAALNAQLLALVQG